MPVKVQGRGMRSVQFECHVRLAMNAPPRGWRQRLGGWLRTLAQRLDGRTSLAIEMHSNLPLSAAERREIIHKGGEFMHRLLREQAILEVCDAAAARLEESDTGRPGGAAAP